MHFLKNKYLYAFKKVNCQKVVRKNLQPSTTIIELALDVNIFFYNYIIIIVYISQMFYHVYFITDILASSWGGKNGFNIKRAKRATKGRTRVQSLCHLPKLLVFGSKKEDPFFAVCTTSPRDSLSRI